MNPSAPAMTLRRIVGGAAPNSGSWPLHGQAATRKLEAAAASSLPPHALMQAAGAALARLALALRPHARQVWVAAGPGNNGGDGLVAAVLLKQLGRELTVSWAPGAARPADAADALARARAAGVRIVEAATAPEGLDAGDLAIDALFGLGLSRPPSGWALAAIRALNAGPAPALAVDLPSGLDGDHGRVLGDAVRARWTLALLTLKPGLFTADGRDHAGEVWLDTLGLPLDTALADAELIVDTAAAWPPRPHAGHKGRFGDVRVVGGAPGMAGAALLAARAALAAGAGRVFCTLLDPALAALDGGHPELMLREPASLLDRDTELENSTLVCGCGGGDALAPWLPALMSRAGRLLLDADALNLIAQDPALAAPLAARAARGRPTVLTPHPLEAARLLGCSTAEVQADRLGATCELAARHRAVVVLKGSGSVVASPGLRPAVNASGNAALASAGSGDVLAGWIGGLWSQGLDASTAARLGVHSHGAAADRWRASQAHDGPLEASRLIDALRSARAR
jgi:hydroxyethylthiazole kinase-like uncharacterized protein yjeF